MADTDGFKIADAYVDVVAKVSRKELERGAAEAGDSAGTVLGQRVTSSADSSIRKHKGAVKKSGGELGDGISEGLISRMASAIGGSALASKLPGMLQNPYVLAGATAAGAVLAPMIVSGLGAALQAGAGVGVIGLGALLLKEEPALISSATRLKDSAISILKGAAQPMLQPMVTALDTFRGKLEKEWAPSIKGIFAGAALGIKPLSDALSGLVSGALPGFQSMMASFGPTMEKLVPSFQQLGASLGQMFTMIGEVGPEAAVALGDIISFAAFLIVHFGQMIVISTKVYTAFRGFFTAIPGWAGSAKSAVGGFISGVVGWFASLPGKAGSAVSGLWGRMMGAFSSAKSGAISSATGMVNGVTGWFASLPGKARSGVSSLWGSMVGSFNSAKSGAISSATSLVSGAINQVKQLPGKARSALSGAKSAVLGAFSGAGGWLVSAGADIIRGLIGGIKSMIGQAASAAVDAGKAIISSAKNALGIGSPSKVAEKELGRWLLPGVTRGVKKTLPRARRAIAQATRSLVPPAGGSGSEGFRRPPGPGGQDPRAAQVINIGSITLDASKMKDIQDVVALITGLGSTSRTYRARTATQPGR